MRKGISPLLAAVLLIAFTMSIAGILATWSTQFVQTHTETITQEENCVGSLMLSTPKFSNSKVYITLSNLNTHLNLTGLKAFLEYNDMTLNKQYSLPDTLGPTEKKTINFITDTNVKPKSIEIVSVECPKYPVKMRFI